MVPDGLGGGLRQGHGGERHETGVRVATHAVKKRSWFGFFFDQGPETVTPWVPRFRVLESSLKSSFPAGFLQWYYCFRKHQPKALGPLALFGVH